MGLEIIIEKLITTWINLQLKNKIRKKYHRVCSDIPKTIVERRTCIAMAMIKSTASVDPASCSETLRANVWPRVVAGSDARTV